MKFGRKLLAVVLAAVLLLTVLTSCGGPTAGKELTKQDIVKLMNDTMVSMGRDLTCNETDAMDEKAEALLKTAQETYEKEQGKSVLELLTSAEAAQAAEIDTQNDSYAVNLSQNPVELQAISADKYGDYIIDSFGRNRKFIGKNQIHTGNTVDVGIAFGKIGETQYIVLLQH